MASLGELIIEYEKYHAQRVLTIFKELTSPHEITFPLCEGDYVDCMGGVAIGLVKIIEDGKQLKPLDQGTRFSAVLTVSKGPSPLEEALWNQAKAKFDLYTQILEDKGQYSTWQDAIRTVFGTKSDYMLETESYVNWLEKEIIARNRDSGQGELKSAREKALQAYKDGREQIATEIFSKKATQPAALFPGYDIEYTLHELKDNNYESIAPGDLKAVLQNATKKAILGTNPKIESIFPNLEGPGISANHGLIQAHEGHLYYTHISTKHPAWIITCDEKSGKVTKPSSYKLADSSLNTENPLAKVYVGENKKYLLHINFFNVQQ